jgi:hypothetical protein
MGGLGSGLQPRHGEARRVVLSILGRGLATPGELAGFAGVSRLTVYRWAAAAGIDWRQKRRLELARVWRKVARHGPELYEAKK